MNWYWWKLALVGFKMHSQARAFLQPTGANIHQYQFNNPIVYSRKNKCIVNTKTQCFFFSFHLTLTSVYIRDVSQDALCRKVQKNLIVDNPLIYSTVLLSNTSSHNITVHQFYCFSKLKTVWIQTNHMVDIQGY